MVLGILVLVAVLVKYPDTLEGRAVISTVPAPVRLRAVSERRIVRLFAHDGAMVAKNDPIAELENTIGYAAILNLENRLKSICHSLQNDDGHALAAVIASPTGAEQRYPGLESIVFGGGHRKRQSRICKTIAGA